MIENVKISVLMSVYNTEFDLVKRALNSVLSQSFRNFELIVIDDGSDNETKLLLPIFCENHRDKITYIRHKNLGQADSINKAISISKGEFITFIDSDDEYKIVHLESCLSEIAEYDLISSTTETIVDKEEDYYLPDKHNLKQLIHVDNCILFATLFGKRAVFEKVDFRSGYAADSNFYDAVTKSFKVKKANLKTYIYYRNIPNSISAKMKRKYLE